MLEITSTTNPIFRNFPASSLESAGSTKRMTLTGVVRKTVILSVWTIVAAAGVWNGLHQDATANPFDEEFFFFLFALSGIVPFALAIISIWKKPVSPFTTPIYGLCQGMFLGFFSVALEQRFPGVSLEAICLSCCTCIALACCYQLGLVRASDPFTKKLRFVPAGAVVYLSAAFLLSQVGIKFLPIVMQRREVSICVLVAVISSITFISGYDLVARAVEQHHAEYMEWYAALGLILSLVWLYLEGIRIFFKDRVPNVANSQQAKVVR
jgi:uncharacterized YccA/Bax inhibitor family protein